jgi:PAT family beta-lactamase induction signal transducer AmpG
MFVYQDYMGHDMLALFLTVFAENTSGAIGDVIFVGYLSSLCSLKFAASQYALFASIAMIARSMLAGFSGVIVDRYGWSTFFIVSAILALPGVLMILKIKNIKRIRA